MKKSELWDLDQTLAKIILPYLKAFRKMKHNGYPAQLKSMAQWNKILDKMIVGMEWALHGENFKDAKAEEGLKLFGEYFAALWD